MMSLAAVDDAMDPASGPEEVRRYSHFEITLAADGSLAELGHGAMGTTYRALDTVLQSPVALKVIGRNVADSPEVRSRFLREARAAARLRHPNVASVFHYGEKEGECFYVMELVEGETLEARVRRDGPLPPALVIEIGVQVARALGAAETQGLVHRDLKPSNLMLVAAQKGKHDKPTEAMLVKVIDFGLAKAVAAGKEATSENDTRHGFVGTPAYASPEQFAHGGKDSRVDTRADIYSLGVTLWYLLCGRTPFRGHTLAEIHGKQIGEALPLQQLTTRRVPAPVTALLRSMLAADPGARPQSARELLEVLERCQERISPIRGMKLSSIWIAASALFVLGAFVATIIMLGRAKTVRVSSQPSVSTDRSVAVMPFENLSPDPAETFFSTGLQEAITGELARIAALKVIGSDSTRSYVPGKRDLARIGEDLGVGHLVEGSVRREGGQVYLSIALVDPLGKIRPWAKQYQRPVSEAFELERAITDDVAAQLRATISPAEKAVLDTRPTTDPVAYDLYLRATTGPSLQSSQEEMRRELTRKVALLDEAVARDPKFVLAYCKLASTHDSFPMASVDASAEERAIDHRSLADAALESARRLDPDNARVHIADATHLLLVSHDNVHARIEIDLARRTLPNDAELEQIAGLIARSQGRWDDAIDAFEKAVSLQPREPVLFQALDETYRAMRRYEDSDRASEHIIALQPDDVAKRLWRATGPLEQRADPGPLRAALAAAPPPDAVDGDMQVRLRLVLALCEHDADAASNLLVSWKRPRIVFYNASYPKAWFEGLVARIRGDTEGAQRAFAAAKAALEPSVQANPGDARKLAMLALADAGLGHKDEAVAEGRRACELMPFSKSATAGPEVAYQLAVIYAWTDQTDLAIPLLENLAKSPAGTPMLVAPSYGDLRLNPVWDPLRSDARFTSIIAKLAPKIPR